MQTNFDPWQSLPLVTADLPGVGGTVRVCPEDFVVEEIPAYVPSGQGTHWFLWTEKKNRNTRDVVRELARAAGIQERDVGVAGLKDKQALTRQYLSVPRGTKAELEALAGDGWRVLGATLHQNKLKTGHLKGNRFRIKISHGQPSAATNAQAIAQALQSRGLPNAFGPQRFGRDGLNVRLGKELVAGGNSAQVRRIKHDRFQRRLAISAYQAFLFNRVLGRRLSSGQFGKALAGDLMKKMETGGLFVSRDPLVDGPRVENFEIAPTGPMFGHRMMEPELEALALEKQVLAEEEVTLDSFRPLKGDAEGTRRAMRLAAPIAVEAENDDLWLNFALPKGSFATVVLREMMKVEMPADLPGERDGAD